METFLYQEALYLQNGIKKFATFWNSVLLRSRRRRVDDTCAMWTESLNGMDARCSPSPLSLHLPTEVQMHDIYLLSELLSHPSSTFSDMNYHSLSLDHHQAVEEDTP